MYNGFYFMLLDISLVNFQVYNRKLTLKQFSKCTFTTFKTKILYFLHDFTRDLLSSCKFHLIFTNINVVSTSLVSLCTQLGALVYKPFQGRTLGTGNYALKVCLYKSGSNIWRNRGRKCLCPNLCAAYRAEIREM